jgi:hypothetical protein
MAKKKKKIEEGGFGPWGWFISLGFHLQYETKVLKNKIFKPQVSNMYLTFFSLKKNNKEKKERKEVNLSKFE